MKMFFIILATSLVAGFVLVASTRRVSSARPSTSPPQPSRRVVRFHQPVLPPGAQTVKKESYRFSGPYTHANLTLYLVHGADALDAKFLTLQEALDQKKAVVHETGNVSQLAIENLSKDEEVFVQSGDIVKGGRQDRVIASDFIVPRSSGKMPIASFCVEQGRWSQRGTEQSAAFSSSNEQAPGKSLKVAAKHKGAQGEVWKEVSENQGKLSQKIGKNVTSAQSASSLDLTLENKDVRETANDYIKALSGVINGKDDAIGFVFAINGQTNNADIYATHELFVKLWPKLLKSAAVEAIAELKKNETFKIVTQEEVQKLVEEPERATTTEKPVSHRVKVYTKEDHEKFIFETEDGARKQAPVHKSYLKK